MSFNFKKILKKSIQPQKRRKMNTDSSKSYSTLKEISIVNKKSLIDLLAENQLNPEFKNQENGESIKEISFFGMDKSIDKSEFDRGMSCIKIEDSEKLSTLEKIYLHSDSNLIEKKELENKNSENENLNIKNENLISKNSSNNENVDKIKKKRGRKRKSVNINDYFNNESKANVPKNLSGTMDLSFFDDKSIEDIYSSYIKSEESNEFKKRVIEKIVDLYCVLQFDKPEIKNTEEEIIFYIIKLYFLIKDHGYEKILKAGNELRKNKIFLDEKQVNEIINFCKKTEEYNNIRREINENYNYKNVDEDRKIHKENLINEEDIEKKKVYGNNNTSEKKDNNLHEKKENYLDEKKENNLHEKKENYLDEKKENYLDEKKENYLNEKNIDDLKNIDDKNNVDADNNYKEKQAIILKQMENKLIEKTNMISELEIKMKKYYDDGLRVETMLKKENSELLYQLKCKDLLFTQFDEKNKENSKKNVEFSFVDEMIQRGKELNNIILNDYKKEIESKENEIKHLVKENKIFAFKLNDLENVVEGLVEKLRICKENRINQT